MTPESVLQGPLLTPGSLGSFKEYAMTLDLIMSLYIYFNVADV